MYSSVLIAKQMITFLCPKHQCTYIYVYKLMCIFVVLLYDYILGFIIEKQHQSTRAIVPCNYIYLLLSITMIYTHVGIFQSSSFPLEGHCVCVSCECTCLCVCVRVHVRACMRVCVCMYCIHVC